MGGELQGYDRAAVDSLIGWWLDSGVDVPVSEQPRDWLRRHLPPPPAAPGPMPAATPVAVPPPARAPRPDDLGSFQAWLASAPGLPLDRRGATRVAPVGSEHAEIMLLADLPSGNDAASGRPIGGEAWELTCRMLAAIGIAPDRSYVASLACFHAPGARIERGELEACSAIARDHIRLAAPKRLILFGDAPARGLLGEPLARARGRVHQLEGVRTIATFHPRWLLQRPSDKALAWRDLLLLMSEND